MMVQNRLVRDVGSYDAGDFDHGFEHREMFPLNDAERAEEQHSRALGDAVKINSLGWSKQQVQREWDLSEEQIELMREERDVEGDEIGAAIMRNFDAGEL